VIPPGLRLDPRPKYLTLALAAFQRTVAYRMSFFMNIVANLIWVAILYYLWRTVFAGTPQVAEFDWPRMRTYVLVAYAVNALLGFYSSMRMMNAIRTGDIANELTRPIDHMKAQLAEAVGAGVVEGLLTAGVALVGGLLVLGALPPASPAAAALFVLSVALGFTIRFVITYMVALLCFWTTNGVGLLWAQIAVMNVLSGALIPLSLFPDWLRPVVLALPFQAIVHTPVAIYLGELQGGALALALGVQLFWVVALWWLARLLWVPASRALTVQGG
jgi:ABC-2 type transport system permease protein